MQSTAYSRQTPTLSSPSTSQLATHSVPGMPPVPSFAAPVALVPRTSLTSAAPHPAVHLLRRRRYWHARARCEALTMSGAGAAASAEPEDWGGDGSSGMRLSRRCTPLSPTEPAVRQVQVSYCPQSSTPLRRFSARASALLRWQLFVGDDSGGEWISRRQWGKRARCFSGGSELAA